MAATAMKAIGKYCAGSASAPRSRSPGPSRTSADRAATSREITPTPGGGAVTGAVSLPMYDWPEIREATDQLWRAIRRQLADRGIDAPATLQRQGDPEAMWRDRVLLLSQTCGYP